METAHTHSLSWYISMVYNDAFDVDRINAVCEQLARFIVKEILDPRGEFYHDGHINRVSFSNSWEISNCSINMTCIFVNIFKYDVVLFVYLYIYCNC